MNAANYRVGLREDLSAPTNDFAFRWSFSDVHELELFEPESQPGRMTVAFRHDLLEGTRTWVLERGMGERRMKSLTRRSDQANAQL